MSIFVNFFVNLKQRPSCLKLVHAKGNTRLLPTFFPTWKSMGLNLYDTIIKHDVSRKRRTTQQRVGVPTFIAVKKTPYTTTNNNNSSWLLPIQIITINSLIPSTDVIQFTLTPKMTTARFSKRQSLSTAVLFRTKLTRTILCLRLMKLQLCVDLFVRGYPTRGV